MCGSPVANSYTVQTYCLLICFKTNITLKVSLLYFTQVMQRHHRMKCPILFSFSYHQQTPLPNKSVSFKPQKLTSDLTGKEQQKKVLEMELKQWRQSTFPHRPAPTVSVTPECSCQGRAAPAPANAASQTLEAEVKQLQAKVKVGVWSYRQNSWVNDLPISFVLLCMPY